VLAIVGLPFRRFCIFRFRLEFRGFLGFRGSGILWHSRTARRSEVWGWACFAPKIDIQMCFNGRIFPFLVLCCITLAHPVAPFFCVLLPNLCALLCRLSFFCATEFICHSPPFSQFFWALCVPGRHSPFAKSFLFSLSPSAFPHCLAWFFLAWPN